MANREVEEPQEKFESWAILELLGHVRLAGKVSEEERFGVKMGRIEIPKTDGGFTTQYFGGGSVYRLTPTTEEIARGVAKANQPKPVNHWELPQLSAGPVPVDQDDIVDDDDQGEYEDFPL